MGNVIKIVAVGDERGSILKGRGDLEFDPRWFLRGIAVELKMAVEFEAVFGGFGVWFGGNLIYKSVKRG
jgi:hypothetical protein